MSKDLLKRHRRVGRSLVGEVVPTRHVARTDGEEALASPIVTVFRCVNCSRSPTEPAHTAERPLSHAEPEWPLPVHEVALPCTGKLQPEHVLKAFEGGADAVFVITCAQDCRYLEGSQRAERRVGYVKQLLGEIGLGADRLTVFRLAASEEVGLRAAEIRNMVLARLSALQPNPLRPGNGSVGRRDGARRDEGNGTRDEAG